MATEKPWTLREIRRRLEVTRAKLNGLDEALPWEPLITNKGARMFCEQVEFLFAHIEKLNKRLQKRKAK